MRFRRDWRLKEPEQVVAVLFVEVRSHRLGQRVDVPAFGGDRRDRILPLLPGRIQSQSVAEFVQTLVAVVDLVHLVDGDDDRNVEVAQEVKHLDVVGDRLRPRVAVDDVDYAFAVDDEDRDERLNELCDRLGLYPPWQQWQDTIAPITAKRGNIDALTEAVRTHLHDQHRDDLFGFF